jgi:hypothetical protein
MRDADALGGGEVVSGWLFLVQRVPREPTSHRVGVWRKLKKLGAVLLHDSVWVLPATARAREHFRWLAAEIEEAGGGATIWESSRIVHGSEDDIRRRFLEQVEPGYEEILRELGGAPENSEPLARRFRQLQERDYFGSEIGRRVRDALMAARGGRQR